MIVRLLPGLLLAAFALLPVAPAKAAGGACPPTPAQAVSLPASRAALAAGRPLTVVAFGSSSTAGAGATGPDRTYPARLEARLRAAVPGAWISIVNRGANGQTMVEMLARLEADVVAAAPVLVIWQAGSNEALRGMDPEEFRGRLIAGLERLRAAGTEVLLLDNQRSRRVLENPAYPRFDAIMAEMAASGRAALFSRAALMRAWAAEGVGMATMVTSDGVHHTDHGYDCLAAAMTAAMAPALRRTAPPVVANRQ